MIKAIAFDLDDTLLNTSEILIPSAVKRIYELILKNGYKKSFTEFNRERLDFVHHSSHREFFKQVVANDPQLSPKDSLLETVVKYFYQPEIPQNLSLIPGAKENLELLNTKYKLYLVTSGVIPTQELKIKALSLEQWIQKTNHLIID
ncbi:MAG: HAD hydrolase-like protein, partial [Bdellovibrionales bacterium]|nr:HAD hydrolase-like protein [Bdellovibrionales bacterium]